MTLLEVREIYHGLQADARLLIQALQPEMREHPVLPYHRNQVGRDTHDQQVQKREERLERQAVFLRVGLNQLEPDAAAGKIVERIGAILAFRIQHRRCRRNFFLRKMMIANDKVNAFVLGIFYFIDSLDAAVEGDNQCEAVVRSPVDTFFGYAIAFVVTVRNIEIYTGSESTDERIDQGYCRGSVDIIVSIYENFFLRSDSFFKSGHCQVHVFHEERIMKSGQ